MTAPATQRTCLRCGQPFTITARTPRKRFCSDRCRAAHWRARPAQADVPNAVPAVPPANAVPAANAVQRCPHCHGELAVVALVIPATAAHIRTPEVTAMQPT